jgi:hypothetical protein
MRKRLPRRAAKPRASLVPRQQGMVCRLSNGRACSYGSPDITRDNVLRSSRLPRDSLRKIASPRATSASVHEPSAPRRPRCPAPEGVAGNGRPSDSYGLPVRHVGDTRSSPRPVLVKRE